MNSNSPLVSVIIPCYNAGRFVEEAVRSVMQQTYTNLEIIVIDDCSTDNTLNILESLAATDDRIKLLRNETNLKLVATLNKGIRAATGKYIARMDADDISLPARIERQVKFLEANEDVAICGAFYVFITKENKIGKRVSFPTSSDELKAALLFGCPFAHPVMMIRRTVLDHVGYYREGLVPAEDYELWLRIAEKYTIANIPEYLLHYRWHENNITIQQKSEQATAMKKIFQLHLNSFPFADDFLEWHLKFLEGTWNKSPGKDVTGIFNIWKKELLQKNNKLDLIDEKILERVFLENKSLAMLSILKSNMHSFAVKLKAFAALLIINPLITLKTISQRI